MLKHLEKQGEKDLRNSKEYLNLKKEVLESVQNIIANSDDKEDIEPLLRLAHEQLRGLVQSDISREKLFWEFVAEGLVNTEFARIHTEIGSLLEDAHKAEAFLNQKISKIIEKLSPTIYKSFSKRGDALRELKNAFYVDFPEIKDLIIGGLEGKKSKLSILKGQPDEDNKVLEKIFSAMGGGKESPWLVEKDWDIPNKEEIKPGLVVEILDVHKKIVHKYLILSEPYHRTFIGINKPGEDLVVKAVELTDGGGGYEIEKDIYEWGLSPSLLRRGKWSPNFKPIKWYMYDELPEPESIAKKFNLNLKK